MKMQKQHVCQKNIHMAAKSGNQTEINTEITEVRTFIEQTMQALLGYNKKLKHVWIQIWPIWKYFKLQIKTFIFFKHLQAFKWKFKNNIPTIK